MSKPVQPKPEVFQQVDEESMQSLMAGSAEGHHAKPDTLSAKDKQALRSLAQGGPVGHQARPQVLLARAASMGLL